MDEIYISRVEKCLDQLDKASIWIFLAMILLIISSLSNTDEYSVGSIKIKKNKSGLFLYLVLCVLNFQILRLLQILNFSFDKIANKSEVIVKLKTHTWIFNPFLETNGLISYFIDNIGITLLIIIWWFGFAIANKEISSINSRTIKKLNTILFFMYLLFGILSLSIIQIIYIGIGDYITKLIFQIAGIIIGLIAFTFYANKYKILQKLF